MIHTAADRLHISPLALSQDLKRAQRQPQRPATDQDEEAVQSTIPPQKAYPRQETALLELLVHYYPEVHQLVHDFLPPFLFTDPTCKQLVEILMLDPPEILTEALHEFDEETQKVISRIQVEESRAIDKEVKPVEIIRLYVIRFWERHLKREASALERRTDLSNEQRYVQTARLKHDLIALSKGWDDAKPMLETRLHKDPDF